MKQFSKKAYATARKAGVEKEKAKDIAKGMFSAKDADDGADDDELEKAEKELGGHMEPDGDEAIKKGDSALAEAIDSIKKGVGRVVANDEYRAMLEKAEADAAERADLAGSLGKQTAALNALTKGLIEHRIPALEKAVGGIHQFLQGLDAKLASLAPKVEGMSEAVALVKGLREEFETLGGAKSAADLSKGDQALGKPATQPKAVGSVVPSPNDPPADTGKMTVGQFRAETDAALDVLKKGDTDYSRTAVRQILDARTAVFAGGGVKTAADAYAEIRHLLPSK